MRKNLCLAVLVVACTGMMAWANVGPLPIPPINLPPTSGPATQPGTQPATQPHAANSPRVGFVASGLLVAGALIGGGLLLARRGRGR